MTSAELLEVGEGEREIAVARREDAVGRADVDVRVRLDRLAPGHAAHGVDRELLHLQGRERVEHVDRHELALAGALAVQQCREHALRTRSTP